MELTNLSYIQANDMLNSSRKDKSLAINRLSTGNRLNKPGLDAGDAAKRGFGGIDVAYFPSTESQKQEELITIGGNIGQGDEFRFSVRELSALLETESDTDYYHLAASDNEDPEYVRDKLFDQISSDANVMRFLDVEKVGTDSLKMTAKMKGDPYLVHSYSSTSTKGIFNAPVETVSNVLNNAKEHTSTINLGGASLYVNDSVSLIINGTTITYQATALDQFNHDQWVTGSNPSAPSGADSMAHGLATKINNTAAINTNVGAVGNRRMNASGQVVYSSGSVLLYSLTRGTNFNASGETISLAAPTSGSETFSGTETQANILGTAQKYSINVGPDDPSAGAGLIAKGDSYTVRISENLHPDEVDNPYTWWIHDPKSQEKEIHRVTVGANATADQIRNLLVAEINNNSNLVNATNGASGELILSSTKPGESYSATTSNGTRDSLSKIQVARNVSPFSVESSMNFLTEMLSQNGAEQSRLNVAHENLENHYIFNEQANSRISDADTAKEATRLAKSSLKMNLATQVMSSASRITDLLTPLTTEHFRSHVLSSTL